MKLTLTDDEIRTILTDAIHKKVDYVGTIEAESDYFSAQSSNGKVEDLGDISFTVTLYVVD